MAHKIEEINEVNLKKYEYIEADAPAFDYMGRIDFKNSKAPLMIYAGSMIRVRFEGTQIGVIIRNFHHYYRSAIGYVIDGNPPKKVNIPLHNKEVLVMLEENLEEGIHELTLYKVHDGAHYFEFKGCVLDVHCGLKKIDNQQTRRIEFFGDSISAGAVIEAVDYMGKEDPPNDGEYCNSWYAYTLTTARKLNAQIHNTSQGGVALLNGTGYFCSPKGVGMEFMYDKLRYNPELGECSSWDFKKYIPHVVVIAIGQNDNYPVDHVIRDEAKKVNWKEHYKQLILNLQKHYPKATFILTTTIMQHDEEWDQAITQVQQEMMDAKVLRFLYKRNGKATPGHVRIQEAEEMAQELAAFIESLGEDIWN